MIKKLLLTITAIMMTWPMIMALTPIEISALFDAGEPQEALDAARDALALKPKATLAAELNLLAGKASLKLGKTNDASTFFSAAKQKGNTEASLWLARIAYRDYDFHTAADDYTRYIAALKKAGKTVPDSIMAENRKVADAINYSERVEALIIIDSIPASSSQYYTHYRLPASAGRLLSPSDIPHGIDIPANAQYPLFANEDISMLLFSAPYSQQIESEEGDTIQKNVLTLMQADHLADGSWSITPHTELRPGQNVYTPFMLSDGQTLYFASEGESCVGGTDIMISSRDPATAIFRTPQNLGMPYNSPASELLLAIDEENGIGWWASQRNYNNTDSITIYTFITNAVRKNHEGSPQELTQYARIASIKDTWPENADYSSLLQQISDITPQKIAKPFDFEFPISGRGVLHYWTDLKSREGKQAMRKYLEQKKIYRRTENRLNTLRKEYAEGKKTNANIILSLEAECADMQTKLQQAANDVFRYEAPY